MAINNDSFELKCARCDCELESEDLRCPLCGLATPFDEREVEAVKAKIMRCEQCGAGIAYDARSQAPKCAFCGSVTHLEELPDPLEEPEEYLPFTAERTQVENSLKKWLGSLGFFRPSDLSQRANLADMTPIWWAAWMIDVNVLASWTADSDARSRRSSWAPESGQAHMKFKQMVVSASRGLSMKETDSISSSYRFGSGKIEPEGPEDAKKEGFELRRSAARQIICGAIRKRAAQEVEISHIPGNSFRNIHTAILVNGLDIKRVALPAYILAYEYNGKHYRAVVNGQNESSLIGDAPISVAKIISVAAAGLVLIILILAILAACM